MAEQGTAEMSALEMMEKPGKNSPQGCAGICLQHKSRFNSWPASEPDHAFCRTCHIHMNLPKKPNAKKDLCPCCGFQVRRRWAHGPATEVKRIGNRMGKVLLLCGHSHNTFQLKVVAEWEHGPASFYCEEPECKMHRQIVWAWMVTI